MIYRMDWIKESELARERAGVANEQSCKGGPPLDTDLVVREDLASRYGGVEDSFGKKSKASNGGPFEIPLKTIYCRLGILLVSLILLIACLLLRIATVS